MLDILDHTMAPCWTIHLLITTEWAELHLGKTPGIFLISLSVNPFDRSGERRKLPISRVHHRCYILPSFNIWTLVLTEDDTWWLPRTGWWCWRIVSSSGVECLTLFLWSTDTDSVVVWCGVVWCDPGDHWTGTVDVVRPSQCWLWLPNIVAHCGPVWSCPVQTPAGYQQPTLIIITTLQKIFHFENFYFASSQKNILMSVLMFWAELV